MNSEEQYANLELGKTYDFMGYKWTACELINNGKTLVIQSHGVTCGAWPGFKMPQFGNGHFYSKSIAGEDISGYDDKMQALYYAIKDTEDSFASYGKGLFLISKEKAGYVEFERTGSGNYWKVLQGVSMNYSPFGATCFSTWLGTVADANSGNAFSMDIGGCIGYSICNQPNEYAIAPAFNLDLSKVEIKGDEIIKKAKFDFASMAVTAQSDSSKELTDDDRLVELCKEASQRAASNDSYVPNLVLQICKRLNWDINKRYNDAEKILSQIVSTGLHITSETVSKSDIFELMFHLLTDLDFVDFVHNYRDQSASDNTPKKMDL